VHGGYYNGDTYSKAEANDQKAVQIRATLRPLPMAGALKGLRLTAFYDADNYMKSDARRRVISRRYLRAQVRERGLRAPRRHGSADRPRDRGQGAGVLVGPRRASRRGGRPAAL